MVAAGVVLGALGTATTLAMFSAPAKHFRVIAQRRDVGEWSVLPYVVGFAQCLLWFVYDIVADLRLHACSNLFGMVIQLVFVSIFAACAKGRRRAVLGQFAVATAAAGAACAAVLLTAHSWSFLPQTEEFRAQSVLGWICAVVCVCMYAAPLDVSRRVIMRRVAVEDCLPWFYSLNIVINLALWTTYALVKKDANVWVPASMGMVLGLLQLLLFACYRNSPPKAVPKEGRLAGDSAVCAPEDPPATSV